jgi:hypothetical protein
MRDREPHPDLRALAESVEIHSPTRYALHGEPRDFAPAETPAAAPQPAAAPTTMTTNVVVNEVPDAPVFMSALETELYSRLYVRPQPAFAANSDLLAQRDFTSALSAANDGVGTWEPGWRVLSVEPDGRFAVTKDQVTFWVRPEGLRTRTGRARPGDFCRVWVGKEMRQLMPGFYFAFGNGDQQESRDRADPLVRFYWHLTRDTAVEYVGLVTHAFNRAGVPFRTKVLSDPGYYVRADAGVLYLERRYFAAARPLVRQLHETLAARLRPEVPMFARRLADGLGLAEDPSDGQSFGQSRCRLAARGLWACYRRGLSDADARLASIVETFRAAGLDPAAPHLERGSKDFYALEGELPLSARPIAANITRRPKRRKRKK